MRVTVMWIVRVGMLSLVALTAGAPVLAQRITYVGELGYELYVPPEWAIQVWDRLRAAGEPHGLELGSADVSQRNADGRERAAAWGVGQLERAFVLLDDRISD